MEREAGLDIKQWGLYYSKADILFSAHDLYHLHVHKGRVNDGVDSQPFRDYEFYSVEGVSESCGYPQHFLKILCMICLNKAWVHLLNSTGGKIGRNGYGFYDLYKNLFST